MRLVLLRFSERHESLRLGRLIKSIWQFECILDTSYLSRIFLREHHTHETLAVYFAGNSTDLPKGGKVDVHLCRRERQNLGALHILWGRKGHQPHTTLYPDRLSQLPFRLPELLIDDLKLHI